MTVRVCMSSTRGGLHRVIVNEAAGYYRWEIRQNGGLVSTNVEATEADARRVVRSTTAYLLRRNELAA